MDTATTRSHKGDRWLIVTVICLFVLVGIGLSTTVVTVIQYRDLAARAESAARCQGAINTTFLTGLQQRSAASDLDRQAVRKIAQSGRDMIAVLLKADSTQDDKIRAVSDWQRAQATADDDLKKADDARAQNPLPLPQSCL